MPYQSIDFQTSDHVARITLSRPEAVNAIDLALARELLQAAMRCDHDPAVRAVVLSGAGRMFCAGGDLRAMSRFGDDLPARLKEMTVYLHAAIAHLMRMRAPLVVAVNGPAAGAGMSLVLCADLAIAAETASFTMAYTAAGLVPDGGSTYLLPRRIGLARAEELMLTNRRLSAREAVEWGLVNRICSEAALLEEAMSIAGSLAAGPTRTYGAVKTLLNQSFTSGLETQMELEGRAIADAAASRDGREGIAAFLEKRPASFTGD